MGSTEEEARADIERDKGPAGNWWGRADDRQRDRAVKRALAEIEAERGAHAARLAELGCTAFEIMAITGHQTSNDVTRYTKAASQKIRAASALVKMTAERK